MNLNSQVCSLELAKRLKELGVNKSSLFYWIGEKNVDISTFGIIYIHEFGDLDENTLDQYDYYSAFTVSELGEMLPKTITWKDGTYALTQDFYASGEFNAYYALNNYAPIDFTDDIEANCRAKMLIHLIKNGLIKC